MLHVELSGVVDRSHMSQYCLPVSHERPDLVISRSVACLNTQFQSNGGTMLRRIMSTIAVLVIAVGFAGCSDLTSPDAPSPAFDEQAPEVQGSNT